MSIQHVSDASTIFLFLLSRMANTVIRRALYPSIFLLSDAGVEDKIVLLRYSHLKVAS